MVALRQGKDVTPTRPRRLYAYSGKTAALVRRGRPETSSRYSNKLMGLAGDRFLLSPVAAALHSAAVGRARGGRESITDTITKYDHRPSPWLGY